MSKKSVGEITFYPRPSSGEKIAISLDRSLGQEIFDLFMRLKMMSLKKMN